jgi:hypothetical protein
LLSTTDRRAARGQTLVLFAISITTILIVAALAFDVGMMLVERRTQQNAADAASLAGARYVQSSANYAGTCAGGGGNAAVRAACSVALANNFDNAASNETVWVYIPPQHGRFVGLPGFIEVQIEATRPSIFGGIVGQAVWPVGTYAVAADADNVVFSFGMLALNRSECKAIAVSGTGVVYSAANIHSNSNGSEPDDCGGVGMSRTGGASVTIDADDATCRSVGTIADQGVGGPMVCDKDPNSHMLPDPLASLPAPPAAPFPVEPMVQVAGAPTTIPRNCPGSTDNPPSQTNPQTCIIGAGAAQADRGWVLSPGLYPGGIDVRGGSAIHMLPGVYWMGGGGFRAANGAVVVSIAEAALAPTTEPSGGVMIYNSTLPVAGGEAGEVRINGGGGTVKLWPVDAPNESHPLHVYNNIVIFQDRLVTETVTLNGAASEAEVLGIIYVPSGEVQLNGNSGTLTVDQVIADTFLINGGGGTINVMHNVGVDAVISGAGLVD